MKGFSTPLKVATLKSEKVGKSGRNSAFLTEGKNIIGVKDGLIGYNPDILPFPTPYLNNVAINISMDWPFPQVFDTYLGTFICTRTAIYRVTAYGGVGTCSVELICTLPINISWPFTVANYAGYPVFASGDCLVYFDPDKVSGGITGNWVGFNKDNIGTYDSTIWNPLWRQPVCICFFRGQIITGGATKSDFGNMSYPYPDNNRLRWSEIGAFRFLGATADIRKNTAGEIMINTNKLDICMRIMPLTNAVVVYTNEKIIELKPVERPVATFSQTDIANLGINNPLAVGGNEDKHLFIDRSGALNTVTSSKSLNGYTTDIKYLGYEEFLTPLIEDVDISTGTNIVSIVYNKVMDEFYISNGNKAFIYNDYGLTESDYIVSSFSELVNVNNATYTT